MLDFVNVRVWREKVRGRGSQERGECLKKKKSRPHYLKKYLYYRLYKYIYKYPILIAAHQQAIAQATLAPRRSYSHVHQRTVLRTARAHRALPGGSISFTCIFHLPQIGGYLFYVHCPLSPMRACGRVITYARIAPTTQSDEPTTYRPRLPKVDKHI